MSIKFKKAKRSIKKEYNRVNIVSDGENLKINVSWIKEQPETIAEIIAALATGKLLTGIIAEAQQFALNSESPEDFEIIKSVITTRMLENKEEIDASLEEDEPIVPPLGAIKHQLTMYHPNSG